MAQAKALTRAVVAVVAIVATGLAVSRDSRADNNDAVALQTLREEVAIAGILDGIRDTSTDASSEHITILRNVRIVDPLSESVHDNQSIIISLGAIYWTGDRAQEPSFQGARIIDGQGRYAAPGLTDMHVHTESLSGYLLNLANGITTIREMDGFPWMLAVRDAVNNNSMTGPTSYVAGTILNYDAIDGGYAVVVRDGITARRAVRQQAACGYDFIKIWNLMPQRLLDVIGEEAQRQGMDLVGHVPHRIAVRYAAEHGMRTMEHLWGFLNDMNQQIGDTDYAVANNPDLWITPTLYAFRQYTTHAQQLQMLHEPGAAYVPQRVRASWQSMTAAPQDASFQSFIHARSLRREIMTQLIAQHAQFLAGTDAANYPFQTMGFALLEELHMLRDAGLSNIDAIRAATTAPAAAMRDSANFGHIAPHMRADIVLLDANPLTDLSAYGHNAGVIAAGHYYPRATLDRALSQLAAIYAAPSARADADTLVAQAEAAVHRGIVFNARILKEAARALRYVSQTSAAERIEHLAIAPTSGACAAITQ